MLPWCQGGQGLDVCAHRYRHGDKQAAHEGAWSIMFRGRQPGTRRPESNEARLRALGVLLDRRGYQSEGLCLLEVNGGFEVTGLTIPERGAYDLAQRTEHISVAELDAAIKQLTA
jgi:hypothetical protein